MEIIVFGIIIPVVSLLLLGFVIRGAIDSSRMSKKMDELVFELHMLRKEIKENKHIIDKKV